jgi:predicted nucleotidyltransferase
MELDRDFSEFLALLDGHKVEYLVVGGYAVAVHGHPRYTGDLDVWVNSTKANAEKLRQVIDAFGFDAAPLAELDFEKETIAFHLGTPPVRIDIMNRISGVTFTDCYPQRMEVIVDGVRINYISFHDLIKNKRASGRGKDLNDVENLQ